MYILINK